MKVAIHQPQFFPYPGFFNKLSMADAFVIMDDVQYDKRFTNRNKILAPQGPMWLTVPIDKADKFVPNKAVQVNNALPWREEHWKKLTYSYKNSRFFYLYRDYLEALYKKTHDLLFDLNLETIRAVMKWLEIDIPVLMESEIGVTGEGTQRLLNVCKALGAETYVSGAGGKNYMDERLFSEQGVALKYQRYEPSPYPQRFVREFVPNLSILDMLFNVGPESRALVRQTVQAELVN
jgi:WbqC-like protein family